MKQLFLTLIISISVLMGFASGAIHFKTTINPKLLPPLFPATQAVIWSNLYYDNTQSLLAFHCQGANLKNIDLDQTDFFAVRNFSGEGQIVKWVNSKWIPTAKEHEYQLQKVQVNRTKNICGYPCYAVTFYDKDNKITSTGWMTNALSANQGIRVIQGRKGALLGYENEKESTYATAIDAVLPANWAIIYGQAVTAIVRQPLPLVIPATGETKAVVIGKSFPQFSMTDVKGTTWNNSKLFGHTTILVVWGDLEALSFPDGTFSETDFEFLQKLNVMLQQQGNRLQAIAPTFTGRIELLEKHPESKKFTGVKVVPDAEDWMSNRVKIKRYPTIIVIGKTGLVTHQFEFSHSKEAYTKLEKLIHLL